MRVTFTAHAVDRYIERVKPCLGPARARVECMGLALIGEITSECPAWLSFEGDCDGYLTCGDVAFPLKGHCAVTCLTRGLLPASDRRWRNRDRARRTFKATHKRPEGGRPRLEEAA